ncbi:MAG: GNAT family N-acetyltransferase [Planctomycetota bacterium]
MSQFNIRPYEPGDEVGIVALWNRVFSEGNPRHVDRNVEHWRALYLENPAGTQVFVALDADGQIIANYSSLPMACVLRGERSAAAQSVDSCVDKAWRGRLGKQSLFVTIARTYTEYWTTPGRLPFNEYIYGLPNELAFPVGTRVIGYKPVHVPMPALLRPLGPDTPAWLDELSRAAEGVTVEEFKGEDVSEAAALFTEHLAEVPLGTWRDAPYLSWRFRPLAGTQYHARLARRAGKLVGVLIYRLGWMGEPWVPMVDWIGSGHDRPAVAALLHAVVGHAHGLGGHRVETWVTPNMPLHTTLSSLGLQSAPTRFNLCIMTFGPRLELEWAKANWCFTMGDCDIF